MNYREIELLGPTYLGTAGTKIIDVDIPDVLSSLELIWRTTVATVSDMTAPHVACLSRIEIVDGSDVLFSLTGEETQAMHFYATGKMPFNNISVVVADYMESVLPIYFGRHLYDPDLAFDPKKFPTPNSASPSTRTPPTPASSSTSSPCAGGPSTRRSRPLAAS